LPQRIYAVLNSASNPRKGQPRKAWVVTLGQVAGATSAPVSQEEEKSGVKAERKADEEEQRRWDVLARREVAGKPVTVFDVRCAFLLHNHVMARRDARLRTGGDDAKAGIG
jgi:prolactin regulatory element-binding protein